MATIATLLLKGDAMTDNGSDANVFHPTVLQDLLTGFDVDTCIEGAPVMSENIGAAVGVGTAVTGARAGLAGLAVGAYAGYNAYVETQEQMQDGGWVNVCHFLDNVNNALTIDHDAVERILNTDYLVPLPPPPEPLVNMPDVAGNAPPESAAFVSISSSDGGAPSSGDTATNPQAS